MKPVFAISLCCCLLLLPGCAAIRKFQETAKRLDEVNLQIDAVDRGVRSIETAIGDRLPELSERVRAIRDAVHAADRDQSGDIGGLDEWYALIVGVLGALGLWGVNGARKVRTDELYDEKHRLSERLTRTEAEFDLFKRFAYDGNGSADQ